MNKPFLTIINYSSTMIEGTLGTLIPPIFTNNIHRLSIDYPYINHHRPPSSAQLADGSPQHFDLSAEDPELEATG